MHTIINTNDGSRAEVADIMAALGTTHPYALGWRAHNPEPGEHNRIVDALAQPVPSDTALPVARSPWRAPADLVSVGSGIAPGANEGKLKRKRAAFGMLPLALDGIDALLARIGGEDRSEIPVALGELTITDSGALNVGGDDLPMTLRCFRGLLANTSTDARRWLGGFDVAPPGELARAWKIAKENGMMDLSKEVRIGGRYGSDGKPEGYRVVSDGYSGDEVDVRAILATARATIADLDNGSEAYRLDGYYNPDTTSVRITFLRHVDTLAGLKAGDVFKAGFTLRTNDAGAGSIGTHHDAWRAMCLNMSRIKHEKIGRSSLRHARSATLADRVDALIRTTVADNVAFVATFAGQWNKGITKVAEHARFTGLGPVLNPDGSFIVKDDGTRDDTGIRAVLDVVAGLRSMRQTEVARDTAIEVMLGGWLAEPGDDLRALVNAVTRAHERVAIDALPQWEAAGGDLLAELTA